jgi:hypothetical protein
VKVVVQWKAVAVRFFVKIEFYGVESNYDKPGIALIASNIIALLDLGVNKYFFVAFGAKRCGHFLN